MARIGLPYANRVIFFEVPDPQFGEVLQPNTVLLPADDLPGIVDSLDRPIGTPPLIKLARGRKAAMIFCDDLTRPTPVRRILPAIIERLNQAGLRDEQITIMMALGTHRPMSPREMVAKVGTEVFNRVGVVNSEAWSHNRLTYLGVGAHDTPVYVDTRATQADLKIGLGTILPHPAAGWGGGGKIIYPGVAGEETVRSLHLQQGETPWNMFGAISSPVRANLERWVNVVGLDFIVNVILTPGGSIYRSVAGHYVKAHRQGVRSAQEVYVVPARSRADIVVVSSHPADLDFWQASKAILGADHLVADGGSLILVTPCPEGAGPHKELLEYTGVPDPETLLAAVRNGTISEPVAASGAASLARMRRRVRFGLVSDGLGPQEAAVMGYEYFDSVQDAVDAKLQEYGPDACVSVIPYGAEIVPRPLH